MNAQDPFWQGRWQQEVGVVLEIVVTCSHVAFVPWCWLCLWAHHQEHPGTPFISVLAGVSPSSLVYGLQACVSSPLRDFMSN